MPLPLLPPVLPLLPPVLPLLPPPSCTTEVF
jgi:hypothetical protein